MTTTSTIPPAPGYSLAPPHSAWLLALRAEWTKLRTLRSTWWTAAMTVAAAAVLAVLVASSTARDWDTMTADERLAFDATSTSLVGVLFGALVLGALGVRSITSEYSTGMIRTTAAAVPVRGRILWAKVAVTAMWIFVIALAANVVGFALGQALLRGEGIGVAISDGRSIAAIVNGALAVSAFGVIGVGLGAVVRRASVANTLMALVVIGGQLVGTAIPSSSQRFLPFNALQASVTVEPAAELMSAGAAISFIIGYALVAVGAAAVVLRRRDV